MQLTFNSLDGLLEEVKDSYLRTSNYPFLILIGGCSRSGKSWLSKELAFKLGNIGATVISLDAWIVPVQSRPVGSKVIDRYDLGRARQEVDSLLQNGVGRVPSYDPVLRGPVDNSELRVMVSKKSILIVEGVVALCDDILSNKSNLKIFVSTNDCLRIKRLIRYHREVKKLKRNLYKKIISEREGEEVLFVKKSAQNADFLFQNEG